MKVAVYHNNHDLRLEDRPTPKVGPGELLVKMQACGICGSDVLEWYRLKKAPCVLGHEIAGEVVELGAGVSDYQIGQRVCVSHHIPCNKCKYCLEGHHTSCETLHTTNVDPGGFSEFIRVPALNVDRGVFPLPNEMSYEEATFVEPLGCVIRGQWVAGVKPGQVMVVLGSGLSGLLHMALARATGVGRIIATDVDPARLEAARLFGADHTVLASEDIPAFVRSVNKGMLADTVLVCAGALSALEQSLQSVERGGTIEFFATSEEGTQLSLPVSRFWRDGLKIVTSYGAAPYDLQSAMKMIASNRIHVKPMISHRLPLEKIGEGFRLVSEGGKTLKVMIQP